MVAGLTADVFVQLTATLAHLSSTINKTNSVPGGRIGGGGGLLLPPLPPPPPSQQQGETSKIDKFKNTKIPTKETVKKRIYIVYQGVLEKCTNP